MLFVRRPRLVSKTKPNGFGESDDPDAESNENYKALSLTPEQKVAIRDPNNPSSKLNRVK
jgi:hypothetical protein